MKKLILSSALVVTIALPILFSRDSSGRRGLRRLIVGLLVYSILLAVLVTVFLTREAPAWFE